MITMLTAAGLLAVQLAGQALTTADSLGEVKRLYSAGAYEDALGQLSGTSEHTAEADKYRALCLLALGRTQEAGRSLEDLVGRNPFFKMSSADVSPRLVTMFQDARRRLLPVSAKRLYGAAKQAFEEKRFQDASNQFRDLLTLLADDDLADETGAVSDLKMLSEGFAKLVDKELEAKASASASPAPEPPVESPTTPAPAARGPRTYSNEDRDAIPPVAVSRVFPTWTPRNAVERTALYEGILYLVITETGSVESASLVRSVHPTYDPVLLEAARTWRFRPAVVDGQAVRYQLTIPVTLGSKNR